MDGSRNGCLAAETSWKSTRMKKGGDPLGKFKLQKYRECSKVQSILHLEVRSIFILNIIIL